MPLPAAAAPPPTTTVESVGLFSLAKSPGIVCSRGSLERLGGEVTTRPIDDSAMTSLSWDKPEATLEVVLLFSRGVEGVFGEPEPVEAPTAPAPAPAAAPTPAPAYVDGDVPCFCEVELETPCLA